MCVNTSKELCKQSYNIKYEGISIEIERWDQNRWHQFRVECTDIEYKDAHQKIRRFLSEICRLYECKTNILTYWWSTNKYSRFDWIHQYYNRIQNGLDLSDYQQIVFDQKKQIALWIYREAMGSGSVFYEFLCYARIINLVSGDRKKQVEWINNNLQFITRNKDKIGEINEIIADNVKKNPNDTVTTLWHHIYVSGRCAIAHASPTLDKVADSDNFNDYDRISWEVRLMHELAGIFINKELSILTYRELSKLQIIQRFQNYYGKEVVDKIKNWDEVDIASLPKIPISCIKLRWIDHNFDSFKNIEFDLLSVDNGCAVFSNEEQWNDNVIIWFMVDFKNNEMVFNVEEFYINDEKIKTEKRLKIDYLTFLKHYFKNWTVEIYDQMENRLITRSNPHIFTNVDIDSVRAFRDSINKELWSLEWIDIPKDK